MKDKISRNKISRHYKSFFELENMALAENDSLMIDWGESLINELVNQEVEKRIAEILPTDKEGQVVSFKRYNLHATDVKHQYKQAAFFLGWRMCLDEIRSRLANPGVNDSQKTEGGGE